MKWKRQCFCNGSFHQMTPHFRAILRGLICKATQRSCLWHCCRNGYLTPLHCDSYIYPVCWLTWVATDSALSLRALSVSSCSERWPYWSNAR